MDELPGGVAVQPGAAETAPHSAAPIDLTARGPHFAECDVTELVHLGAADAGGAHPSVVLQVSMPPALRALVDPEAFRGAVRLLVEVACRDSEPGSEVKVSGRRHAGVTVLVTDRGSDLNHDQVMEGFGGADRALALAGRLVALHGGLVWAEQLPAGGIKLAITVPGTAPDLSPEEAEAAREALDALAELETEVPPDEGPEVRELLEEVVDQAVAASDGIATVVEVISGMSEIPEEGDDLLSLADLVDVEPDVLDLLEVRVEPPVEPSAEDPVNLEPELPDPASIAAETLAEDGAGPAEPPVLSLADLVDVEPDVLDLLEPPPPPEPLEPPVPPEPPSPPKPPPLELVEDPVPPVEPRPEPRGRSGKFIPDPLHPATALLRSLMEESIEDLERGP